MSKLKYRPVIQWLLKKLKNKYVLTAIIFIVWLAFFDKNDFISQYTYRKQLSMLKAEKQYYIDEVKKNKQDLSDLMSKPANIEKYAREKYYMKKDDEEIFVIVNSKPAKEEKDKE